MTPAIFPMMTWGVYYKVNLPNTIKTVRGFRFKTIGGTICEKSDVDSVAKVPVTMFNSNQVFY